jgi:hypothetical protein
MTFLISKWDFELTSPLVNNEAMVRNVMATELNLKEYFLGHEVEVGIRLYNHPRNTSNAGVFGMDITHPTELKASDVRHVKRMHNGLQVVLPVGDDDIDKDSQLRPVERKHLFPAGAK